MIRYFLRKLFTKKKEQPLKPKCTHGIWMMLHSENKRKCYRCGYEQKLKGD
jgi:ribosomal protein S27AE